MNLEIAMTGIEQRQADLYGWKEVPKCPLLIRSRDENLYCAYDYDLLRARMEIGTPPTIFDDIGLNQSYEEALAKGDITKKCSPEECPSLMRRLGF